MSFYIRKNGVTKKVSGLGSYTEGDGIDISGNNISVDTTFTESATRTNIASGDSLSTIFGKIKKWFSDLPSMFVSKSGDTMTGVLHIDHGTANVDAMVQCKRTDTQKEIGFGVGSSGQNRGIYDYNLSKWIVKADGNNDVTFDGKATTATTADNATALNNYYSSRPSSANLQVGDGKVRYFVATSAMTTGKPTIGDAHVLHMAWDNNGGWDGEIAIGTEEGMQYRNQYYGTWRDWRTVLDSRCTYDNFQSGSATYTIASPTNGMSIIAVYGTSGATPPYYTTFFFGARPLLISSGGSGISTTISGTSLKIAVTVPAEIHIISSEPLTVTKS